MKVKERVNTLTASASDLIADYKARGLTGHAAWDEFVKDRALKPEIDLKKMLAIYDQVIPRWLDTYREVNFFPTHFDLLLHHFCQIRRDWSDVSHLVWDNGHTGSNPPSSPPDESRFVVLSAKLSQAIESGMVVVVWPSATIVSPPNPSDLLDDEWIAILTGAGEIGKELSNLGFDVVY